MYRLYSDTPGPACKFDPQKLAVFVHILLDLWIEYAADHVAAFQEGLSD